MARQWWLAGCLGLVCGMWAAAGYAEETLGELRSKNAERLSRAELEALLPNAKVRSVSTAGSERIWRNDPEGKFIASSSAVSVGVSRPTQGNGSWRISDDGKFCVEIEWPTIAEKWCRSIYRLGTSYFALGSDKNPQAKAYPLDLSR